MLCKMSGADSELYKISVSDLEIVAADFPLNLVDHGHLLIIFVIIIFIVFLTS